MRRMDRATIDRTRRILAIASMAAMVSCLLIVLVAMTPSGEWISIEEVGTPSISSDDSGFVIRYSAEVTSHMPYDLDDLKGELHLTDPVRGSSALICEFEGLSIPAGGSVPVEIESEISAFTAALIFRDLTMRDGAPLHFDFALSCTYMLGMADFRVGAGVDVPVTAPGEKISYGIVEDTEDSFIIAVNGLAEWLLPGNGSLTITGGDRHADASWSSADGTLTIGLYAEDLDGTLEVVSRSDDPSIVDGSGHVHPIDGEDVGSLMDALGFLGRKA